MTRQFSGRFRYILVEARAAAQTEAESRSDASSAAFPLLQVGLGGPHCGVVGHVVVGGEQLHFLPTRTQ